MAIDSSLKLGKLVIFVGSSGSGKDSLIQAGYERMITEGYPVHRVKRWITRPSHHSERYKSVSLQKFQTARQNNVFVLWWHIYDTHYGVPRSEIDPYLSNNNIVLVNLSRTMCKEALEYYPDAKIVLIKVPPGIAEERIHRRARDDATNLQARLKRLHDNITISFPELVLQNDGKLDASVEVLIHYLKALI